MASSYFFKPCPSFCVGFRAITISNMNIKKKLEYVGVEEDLSLVSIFIFAIVCMAFVLLPFLLSI
jgi:hypothetical protein